MMQVSALEAETKFLELVSLIEEGREDCIIITRHGKPVVMMVPYEEPCVLVV